jgi:uncharacterized protein YndB with AHSA1/START domain
MMQKLEKHSAIQPAPVRISRVFPAPRATVFKAWSMTEHVKRWFAPEGFTVPQAKVHMHVGGPFEVCMRAPDGVEHWTRGTFAEVVPVERLVLDLYCEDTTGHRLFGAYTEVMFAEIKDGTRMDVVQTYSVIDPDAAWMVSGAPQGWAQTLDKLTSEVTRMHRGDGAGIVRSVAPVRRLSHEHNVFREQGPSACNQFLHRTLSAEARHLNAAGRNARVAGDLADRIGCEEEPVIRIYDFAVGEYAFDVAGTERIRNGNNDVANIALIGTQKRLQKSNRIADMFDHLTKQCDIEVAFCDRVDHLTRRNVAGHDIAQPGNPARRADGLLVDIDAQDALGDRGQLPVQPFSLLPFARDQRYVVTAADMQHVLSDARLDQDVVAIARLAAASVACDQIAAEGVTAQIGIKLCEVCENGGHTILTVSLNAPVALTTFLNAPAL